MPRPGKPRGPDRLRKLTLAEKTSGCLNQTVLPPFEPTTHRQFYKSPPLVERFIVLECEQTEEDFSQRILAWSELVKSQFPIDDHQTRWELQVEEIDGVPVVESAEAVARITYVYRRDQAPACGLVTRRGVLRLGILRSASSALRYEDFRPLIAEWGQKWMDHFDVRPQAVAMRYINAVSPQFTPQLFVGGKMRIDQVLTAFGEIPGTFQSIIPPFRCEASTLITENAACRLESRLKIHAVQFLEQPTIMVEIQASVLANQTSTNFDLLDSLDLCHEAVDHQFECVFTPSARQSFQPIKAEP